MAHSYEIVEANLAHAYRLARDLREADAEELRATGIEARRIIRHSFKKSLFAKTAFIDGKIAAMWGLSGDIIGDEGSPWLLTTPQVELMPVAFLKEAKKELQVMLNMKKRLSNHVHASYRGACRLLEFLGFTIEPFDPKRESKGYFRKFSMER